MSSQRTVGVLVAWLVGVGVATGVGMAAIGAIGSGIVDDQQRPLSEAEVSERLAAPPASGLPSTSSAPTSGPTSVEPTTTVPPGGASEVVATAGGTVIVRCSPAVEIVSATPAQGYHVEDIEPNDGGQRVRFRSGDERVEIHLSCDGSTPVATVELD